MVLEMDQAIFLQDSASHHFAKPVKELLNDNLCWCWIGREGDLLDWPHCLPACNGLWLLLMGLLKEHFNTYSFNNDKDLKRTIEEELYQTQHYFFLKA